MNDDVELARGKSAKNKRNMNRHRYSIKMREQNIDRRRAVNESINTLLSVVKYLNAVQDGDALHIEGTYSRTDIDKPSRILNCHEEDIMNASLITLKKLVESLLPNHKSAFRMSEQQSETQ